MTSRKSDSTWIGCFRTRILKLWSTTTMGAGVRSIGNEVTRRYPNRNLLTNFLNSLISPRPVVLSLLFNPIQSKEVRGVRIWKGVRGNGRRATLNHSMTLLDISNSVREVERHTHDSSVQTPGSGEDPGMPQEISRPRNHIMSRCSEQAANLIWFFMSPNSNDRRSVPGSCRCTVMNPLHGSLECTSQFCCWSRRSRIHHWASNSLRT